MADLKISQLPAASTPLAGTEVLPIVQSSSTDKVSVANLTAGRTVSMSGATVTGLTASKGVFTDGSKNLSSTGTLGVDQGGTGNTSWASTGLVYADSATSLTNSTALTFASSKLSVNNTSGKFEVLSGSGNATGNALYVNNDSKTTGTLAKFYTNNGNAANSGDLVQIINDFNAGGTADLLYLQQDDDGDGLQIVMDRGGAGIKVTAGFGDCAQFTAGNIKFMTAAKGINFTANTALAGMTSQLLNWYEEGTYTPTITASSGALTTVTASGNYTRIGRQVTANIQVTLTNIGTASGALIATLPFTCGLFPAIGTGREDQNTGVSLQPRIQSAVPGSTYIVKYDNTTVIATGNVAQVTITYFV